MRLCRVGNRLLCPTCFNRLKQAPAGTPVAGSFLESADVRELLQRTVLATFAGLGAKTLLYVPLFLWARHSDLGAAALRGTVAADVFTWIVFAFLEWQFRKLRVTAGALFELVLVILYLNREALFDITGNVESTALSLLFFFAVMFGKTALWVAEWVLEFTGVKEPASL
jgi:hypothetical protein